MKCHPCQVVIKTPEMKPQRYSPPEAVRDIITSCVEGRFDHALTRMAKYSPCAQALDDYLCTTINTEMETMCSTSNPSVLRQVLLLIYF